MDLKSVHSIFTDRILRIPSYQRGYSWNNNTEVKEREDLKSIKGQLMDLWNDIQNIPDGKWHYTGLLTLAEIKKSDYQDWLPNRKQYSIVDGQQRITTILVLISVLVEFSKKYEYEFGVREGDTEFHYLYISRGTMKAFIFGYDQDNPSDKYFRKHILSLDEVEGDSKESIYTENLIKAKNFFEIVVGFYLEDSENKVDALQALYNKVTNQLRLNEYILPNELDEYVVFETMNNRGKPLSQLEKLKNRLMYLTDKMEIDFSEKNNLVKAINTAWITIYQSLGTDKQDPLDDDDFIKAHWIMYFDQYDRSESNVYSMHLFNHFFTIERVYESALIAHDILNYVKSLQASSIEWNKIHHPIYFEMSEEKTKLKILGLHRVGFRAAFKPLVLACLLKKTQYNLVTIVDVLEKFAFKVFHAADRQSNTGDSKLYRLAAQIYQGAKSTEQVISEMEGYTSYYYNFTRFKNLIDFLFEDGSKQGFYKWGGLKYTLFEYDQYLRSVNKTSTMGSELIWKEFKNKETIEHIFPQSAYLSRDSFCKEDDSPERLAKFEELQNNWSHFQGYSSTEKKRLCNSLGNLLAISHSDNASFKNDPFLFKVDQSNKGAQYKNRGYKYDSLSAQIVAIKPEWTPESLLNRGIKILDFILIKLDEPLDKFSYEEKVRLLGLDFLHKDEQEDNLLPANSGVANV